MGKRWEPVCRCDLTRISQCAVRRKDLRFFCRNFPSLERSYGNVSNRQVAKKQNLIPVPKSSTPDERPQLATTNEVQEPTSLEDYIKRFESVARLPEPIRWSALRQLGIPLSDEEFSRAWEQATFQEQWMLEYFNNRAIERGEVPAPSFSLTGLGNALHPVSSCFHAVVFDVWAQKDPKTAVEYVYRLCRFENPKDDEHFRLWAGVVSDQVKFDEQTQRQFIDYATSVSCSAGPQILLEGVMIRWIIQDSDNALQWARDLQVKDDQDRMLSICEEVLSLLQFSQPTN